MSNFCSNCGAKLEAENAFCPECGSKIAQEQSPVDSTLPPVEAVPPVAKVETPTKPTGHFYDTNFNNSGSQCDNGFKENFLKRDGRLNRLRFFKRDLVVGLVSSLPILFLMMILGTREFEMVTHRGGFMAVQLIWSLPFLYVQYMLMRRRLQDLDKGDKLAKISVGIGIINLFITTENSLIYVLSLVELGISLYLLLAKGTTGDNQYGPDPLAER